MKNLIIAFSLLFAVGVSAQSKTTIIPNSAAGKTTVAAPKSNVEKAKQNTADLNAFTPLSTEKQAIFTELFTTKYRMMTDAGDSAERKQIVSGIIAKKLEATLDGPTFEKVKNNTALFQKLIN
ncbi:MAG: hypothetical protein CFE23_03920 [Flavobacterium sp. BFFFF1]|uniref:hypothetical protein n=1 Tax=unclassified Flavobacterium TaxID=196869 RepID=UPI000BD181DF|nr:MULTISPECIES: hypothetical protein [unclassified Flavobacterium]OYU81628.1 MAG: hypothetical protein CFE23_03920 [Flavobacterium sp. BFFFF1]